MTDRLNQVHKIVNRPEHWDFSDARELYAGLDLGTYKAIAIIVDEHGLPRAAAMRTSDVVRSGLIVDYVGALDIVKELMGEIRSKCPLPIEKGATSYPPRTEYANLKTTSYILEGVGLEVLAVPDEPTAANLVLDIGHGAIVDVGGGTTGIAVIQDGRAVDSMDEATGGVHLSLVLAGAYKISYEEAEAAKMDPKRAREVLLVVRPVIEKIASIVSDCLKDFSDIESVCLVGGACELPGFVEVVSDNIGFRVFRPKMPQLVTPLGISLSCLSDRTADLVGSATR